MSDTKAAEALIYNNSCFHLFVFSFFLVGVDIKKKSQYSRGQHNSLSYHGLEF